MSPKKALTFWFTGLSGAGKTTLAYQAAQKLEREGKSICILDGDQIRQKQSAHLSFTPEDIRKNNQIVSQLCLERRYQYDYIFVPLISPFEEVRSWARSLIGETFFLVYVKASLENLIEKDVKGLYKKALRGEIENFIGIGEKVPFEEPKSADFTIQTDREAVMESVEKLIHFVKEKDAALNHV